MDPGTADLIANLSINHYQSLGKKGKPILGKEWTLLSSIVMKLNGEYSIVAMATGSKCLGYLAMSPTGNIVNDSHAEVLTRRCFLRYLYDQILTFQKTGESKIINGCNKHNQYEINHNVEFHFYTSHVPCGDASIIPKHGIKRKYHSVNDKVPKENENNDETHILSNKVKEEVAKDSCQYQLEYSANQSCIDDNNPKLQLISNNTMMERLHSCAGEMVDIHRTGAKCLRGEDLKLAGPFYHQVRAVRTKPGRGEPTLSVSCSDKMARWIFCGLQGALLSQLLSEPVRLTSVVVGGGGPYSVDVLRRALITRSGSSHPTTLLRSTIVFPHSRYSGDSTARPCPSAILWTHICYKSLEVCVEGRKQGAAKNCLDKGCLAVCKRELLRLFLSAANKIEYEEMSYKNLKVLAERYNNSSKHFKTALKSWTSKPLHLEDFKIN